MTEQATKKPVVAADRPLDTRAIFHDEEDILEIDLSDLTLRTPRDVIALYDMLDRRVAATARKWFFLINYRDCIVHQEAWFDHARRGKKLNLTFSLGTVRFNTPDDTKLEIEQRADREKFEANLVANREAAIAELSMMRDAYRKRNPRREPLSPDTLAGFAARVSFEPDARIMEVDFSDFEFATPQIVNGFYDMIEKRIAESGQMKWYFLVNYRNCEVAPEAWVAFAHRGKRLNVTCSLGSVRYAATGETEAEIAMRSKAEDFDLNLYPSRASAVKRIAAMRGGT
jgi:hypothetical protein